MNAFCHSLCFVNVLCVFMCVCACFSLVLDKARNDVDGKGEDDRGVLLCTDVVQRLAKIDRHKRIDR